MPHLSFSAIWFKSFNMGCLIEVNTVFTFSFILHNACTDVHKIIYLCWNDREEYDSGSVAGRLGQQGWATSTVKHPDGRWHPCSWMWGSVSPQRDRKAVVTYQLANCSCHCCSSLLWHDSPTASLSPVNTDTHPCARLKSIPVYAPHVRNWALFSLICIKQRWSTSQPSV